MTVEATDGGHCKDTAHVSVVTRGGGAGYGKGYMSATYLPHTSCVNVPGYDGWVVQAFKASGTAHPIPGLRFLPELAEVIPVQLRRAAKIAERDGTLVVVEHTYGGEWIDYVVLTAAGARSFAKSVLLAVELAPPGAHG